MRLKTSLIVALLVALTVSCSNQTTTSPTTSATTAAATGPATENFSSALGIRGATSHAFNVTTAGTITAMLTSVGPPALTVGLGLGIPGAGPPCTLSTSINASLGSSTQLVGPVDPGRYCVQVFDLGTVTNPLAFVVTIEHP
jgi:hypothetical protein